MKLSLYVDTTLFHCTAILRSDTTLKQNKKISNFISSFDIVNSFWPVKLYSIFDQHLDLVVSIATAIVSALN